MLLWGVCVCVVRHAENSTLLMYMSASLFFCSFSREKRITFHDVCFSKPLTFHNGFMFFLLLVAVSNTFRNNKPYLRCKIGRA